MENKTNLKDTLFGDLTQEPDFHQAKMTQTIYLRLKDYKIFYFVINCSNSTVPHFMSLDKSETLSMEQVIGNREFGLIATDDISLVAKDCKTNLLSRFDNTGKPIRNPKFYEEQTAFFKGKKVVVLMNGVWDEEVNAYRMMWNPNGCGYDSELSETKS